MVSLIMPAVIVDRWFEKTKVAAFVEISAMVALTAIAAQVAIYLPFTPVPLTLQTFVILLGAAALGAQRAAISQVAYLSLALAGLPIMADGKGGLSAIYGATSGYLVGFIFASILAGHLANKFTTNRFRNVFISYFLGSLVIYVFGVLGLIFYANINLLSALSVGVIPFVLGDIFKAIAAGLLLPSAWKLTEILRK
ncbi:MAG: biotin transporter BioY [Candidatus Nanopelagicales bacterium]|jgi:biotin transport system substrate-specific component